LFSGNGSSKTLIKTFRLKKKAELVVRLYCFSN